MNKERELIPIIDFIEFNYNNIAFDITGVDQEALLEKLKLDMVSHLWEIEDSNYIAIWNCDLQGFSEREDIWFDILGTTYKNTYKLASLVHNDDGWFYHITEDDVPISE